MKKKAKRRVSVPSDTLLAAIPSNWCDPILSGPDSALPLATAGRWGCPDIERLLNGIRERLRKAIAANASGHLRDRSGAEGT